ncbi:aminopeptidase [Acerihabitans arboris]|uniref:Aminopeptidase n=1 Tax=Acerihabitans arboris TaxID=2691583 RepID=A0A845S8Z8_9GAMM|nr:aminopeptidase [Acerihabitans arboris]NDL61203.1 aminopeptidase [Acerihabitans arboris]
MFHPGRSKRARLTLCLGGLLAFCAPAVAFTPSHYAEEQIRYIATYFPGRMAGSPAELMAADYLQHRFNELGFHSDLRAFNTRYLFHGSAGKADWRKITATSVIAARAGATPGEVLIVAHADTFMPRSDKDLNNNLGGLTLQGVDDNASGLGVMLGLAQQLGRGRLTVGVRFVALSAGEPETLGADDYLQRMSAQEKRNTLLVINLDSLVAGDKLRVNYSPDSGDARVRALVKTLGAQARRSGIPLLLSPGIRTSADCAGDALPFAKAGFAVLDIGSGTTGDGCRQRKPSRNFPQGMVRYQGQRDNLQYLDSHLTGQISKRARDGMRLIWPVLQALTQGGKA